MHDITATLRARRDLLAAERRRVAASIESPRDQAALEALIRLHAAIEAIDAVMDEGGGASIPVAMLNAGNDDGAG